VKLCPSCKKEKDISCFYKNKANKSGYASQCKVCFKLSQTKFKESNPQRHREIDFKSRLKRRYGISLNTHEEILSSQEYKCAICKVSKCSSGLQFSVDHCHETGKVRGLLCCLCNKGLGSFKDNTAFLKEAIQYLERYDFRSGHS